MIATATTPSAARFARMVTALSVSMTQVHTGGTWNFIVADGMEVTATRFGADHLHLSLSEFDGPSEAAVSVYPGSDRPFEVATPNLVIGETRGIEAAISIALDYLFRPLAANAQRVPDLFAV